MLISNVHRGRRIAASLALSLAAFCIAVPSEADESVYSPDIAELDGQSTYGFAIDPPLRLDASFTLEFWIAAAWSGSLGYDPVALTSGQAETAQYVISVLEDKDGLVLVIDGQEWVIAHDFSNQQLHHVALISDDGEMDVVINGTVRDRRDFQATQGDSEFLWIGSLFGEDLTFIGSIGQLRLWSAALSVETLRQFALTDIAAFETDHPNAVDLHAFSVFQEDAFLMVEDVLSSEGDLR